jgi:hypothetical protein
MLTCLSRILVFCWCNHLWRSGQLFFVHFLMSVSGFRWWDHKPLLCIPGLVVRSWGSWFLLLVSFWSTADWSDQNCLFTAREVVSNVCSSIDGIWTYSIDALQRHSLSLTSSALYIYICCVVLQGCPSPMTFYELALIIICPFPAILFSLSASYSLNMD